MHLLLIPLLRILSDGKFHAGSDLAHQLGVSRATVSNALKTASAVSVEVFKVRGRGYQLPNPPDWLAVEQVRHHLSAASREFAVEIVDVIDSTNSALLRAERPSAAPYCLAAEFQLAGRGRRGRHWLATLGGSLTCSLRWPFNQSMATLAGLSLAVGVGLLRALRHFHVTDAQLKWPNDVLWREHKLAGILIEVQGEANGPSLAVIGIGINLRLPVETRSQIDQEVTDLYEILGHAVSRNALLAELLNQLQYAISEFEAHGLKHLRQEWLAAHAHAGQALCVTLANGSTLTGVVDGLNPQGALLLKNASGHVLTVHSGDIQLLRQQKPDAITMPLGQE